MSDRLIGTIVHINRLGEQGGYAVIKSTFGQEFIFTLQDATDYHGGDIAEVGYIVGAEVYFFISGETKVDEVRLARLC